MKKIFILISGLIFIWGSVEQAIAGDDGNNGGIPPIRKVESLQNQQVVNVQSQNGIVQINFPKAYNDIKIIIYDNAGLPVYQNIISVVSGDMLQIDTSSWNGLYTLEIADQQGNPIYVGNIECL